MCATFESDGKQLCCCGNDIELEKRDLRCVDRNYEDGEAYLLTIYSLENHEQD